MKTYYVTAYPYATREGNIEVPDDVKPEEVQKYIENHFDDIKFGEARLDYAGTEIEFHN